MMWSPGLVIRRLAMKCIIPSQHVVVTPVRDGGVRVAVFPMLLMLLGWMKFSTVEAIGGHPAPFPALARNATPPPPPHLTSLQQQSEEVMRALRANHFTTAAFLIQTYMPIAQRNITLFVPTNEAFALVPAGTPVLTLLMYHEVSPQYNFDKLEALPIGSRLVTALRNNSIVVSNNDQNNYRVNNVRIVLKNACEKGSIHLEISCHGVEAVLNETLFGTPKSAPVPSPAAVGVNITGPLPVSAPSVSSPPVLSILPSPTVTGVPAGSPEGVTPPAQAPTEYIPIGGASTCRLRAYFRHLVLLGVMSIGFGF